MAAKVFEVIGAVVIILSVLIIVTILHFTRKGLKKVNKVLGNRRGDIRKDLSVSMDGLQVAQVQIEALSVLTSSVKAGMSSVITAADGMVTFFESDTFQVGVPVMLWFMLVAVAVPRAVFGRRKKVRSKIIPPPSWEL